MWELKATITGTYPQKWIVGPYSNSSFGLRIAVSCDGFISWHFCKLYTQMSVSPVLSLTTLVFCLFVITATVLCVRLYHCNFVIQLFNGFFVCFFELFLLWLNLNHVLGENNATPNLSSVLGISYFFYCSLNPAMNPSYFSLNITMWTHLNRHL